MEQIYILYRLTDEKWWLRTRCPLDQRWSLRAAVCPVKHRHKSPCCSDFYCTVRHKTLSGSNIDRQLYLKTLGFAVGRATFPSFNEAKRVTADPRGAAD